MKIINTFTLICLCFTSFYLFGLFVFITDHAENKCEMTYMFQYPQFVQIAMNTYQKYQKYALYAYSEGRFTENTRNMKFEGIPVLFVPGNAGSYKQVRSLASVALRKALSDRPGFHFDYFTVDFNEELSGINGALLNDQMQFVSNAIERVLELYGNASKPPKSVILIGHSMGGIILRSLIATFPASANIAPLIITLATPHKRPPAIFDTYMHDFYKNLAETSATLPNKTTIISITGGYNDFLVPSYLSHLNGGLKQSLYAVSTNIPRVWLPTDHLCILWCKQLVLTINKALFDSVDAKTKQLAVDPKRHYTVFHHHLIQNSGIKINLAHRYAEPILNLDNRGEWTENLYRQYSVELKTARKTQWYMIRHHDFPQHETVTILAVNMESADWVFACGAIYVRGQSRVCNDGIHLTHISTMAPSLQHKRRVIDVNLHELKKNYSELTHVVVRALPNDDPVILHVDIYNSQQRTLDVALPHILSFKKHQIVGETEEKALRYTLVFPELQHVRQSYKLFVEAVSCTRAVHHATASLIVPWADEGAHAYVTENSNEPLHLRLYSSQPHNYTESATVKLTLDPNCRYQISVRSSLVGTLGQLARFYSSFLIANIAVVVLMTLKHQLTTASTEKSCTFFLTAISESAKPFKVLPFARMLALILSFEPLSKIFLTPDWDVIKEEGLDFLLLPIFLYVCSAGLVWILALALSIVVVISESTIQRIALMFLARSFAGNLAFSDYLMTGLQKLPIVVASFLIILCFSTCGGLALCVGAVFYFLKLTQMSQEFVEQLVWSLVKNCAVYVKNLFGKGKQTQEDEKSNGEENRDAVENVDGEEVEEEVDNGRKYAIGNVESGGSGIRENVESSGNEIEEIDSDERSDETESEQNVTTEEEDEDEEESFKEVPVKNESERKESVSLDTAIFFHFTLFLIWCLVAALCIPSVLTWAHNFRYSTRLVPDPSFWPGIILCICAVPLWQLELPRFNRKWYKLTSHVIFILAIASQLFAVISLYRLVYLLTFSIVVVTLHQLFAPIEDEAPSAGETKENSFADRVKAKWE